MDSDPDFVKDILSKAANGDEACKAATSCLQAMRSVILSNHCPCNATAYFAATVAAMQQHTREKGDDSSTSAMLFVLKRSLGSVPANVVQTRFNDVLEVLSAVLKSLEKEDLVKQVLSCLSAIADLAFDAGSRPNRKVLKPVFALITDERQAVRHRAQLAAASILKRSAASNDQQSLEYASQHLSQMIAAARPDKKRLDDLPVKHALAVLKSTAKFLPSESLGDACDAALKLPALLGQHPVCVEAFEFFTVHLSKAGSLEAIADKEQHRLLAVRLLRGLLDVPMSVMNVAYVAAYSKALSSAVTALVSQPPAADVAALMLRAVKQILALFVERDPTIQRSCRDESQQIIAAIGEARHIEFLEALPELCRPLLGFECKGAWPHELPVIASVFDAFGAIRLHVPPAEVTAWTGARFAKVRELLQELTSVRDKVAASELNVFGKELHNCFASAVAAFGPELALSVVDLRLLEHSFAEKQYEQLSRSWMLPILKESCKRTSVAFFVSACLPLASSLKGRAQEAESKSPLLAKKYLQLLDQVWALMPGLFTEPLDLQAALMAEQGRFAKQLVSVLLNEAGFRNYVWLAFTRATESVLSPATPLSKAVSEPNTACLKTLSARVLPEMLTTYVKQHTESEGLEISRVSQNRHIALEAIQTYAKIIDTTLISSLFKNIVAKLLKATQGESPEEVAPLADLANALVPHLPGELLELVLKVFQPMLSGSVSGDASAAASAQKAAYRAVRSMLRHPAAADDSRGDATQVLEFWAVLRDARQTCSAPALKGRLSAMEALLALVETRLAPRLKEEAVRAGFVECLKTMLPEIMLHLRDQSTAVREAARECLHVAATTAVNQDMQTEIVTLLSAGLAGLSPHSKASAVDALSRLLYEHSARVPRTLQDRLIQIVLLLVGEQNPAVFRSALKFTKVVVFVVPKEQLASYLPAILKLFSSRHAAHSKMLVRKIIERLAKLCPADQLSEHFPEAHKPLLAYVQKSLVRRQRPNSIKAVKPEEEEEGEGEDKDVDMGDSKESKAKSKKSWDKFQQEDDDGEPLAAAAPSSGGKRKRGRGEAAGAEPVTSPVMAHEAVQNLLDAWEAESDSDEEEGGGSKKRKNKRRHDSVETTTWIKEDADVPLDFMSADAAHSVLTTRPSAAKRRRGEQTGEAGAENRVDALRRANLTFAEDGRLIVKEDVDPEDGEEKKFNLGTDGSKKAPGALSKLSAQRKERAAAKAVAKSERKRSHVVKGLEGYKPGKKNSQGDARRKGQKLEPYAYVSLNPKILKEKYRKKAITSFSKVISDKKKGIVRGGKIKQREIKLKEQKKKQKASKPKRMRKPNAR